MYLIFVGEVYYPVGGSGDFYKAEKDLDVAIGIATEMLGKEVEVEGRYNFDADWTEVIDGETGVSMFRGMVDD